MASTAPFFIVGCVRSGTTMLRNLLRGIPHLVCPEETQYYRWAEPFGSPAFIRSTQGIQLMKKHRQIDGVSEETFEEVIGGARSRRDLYVRYLEAFKAAKGKPDARWFDKSPQNVYGLPLLLHDFPEAKVVHIVRNPLNVVASLAEGKVIAMPNALAAANYWTEAVSIFNTIRPLCADRSYEIRYEQLTDDPHGEFRKLLAFLGEDDPSLRPDLSKVHPERDRYRAVLTPDDLGTVQEVCGRWAAHYGYDLTAAHLAERVD
jgi:hypothetical protein